MKESKEMSTKELSYVVGILYEAGSDTTTMVIIPCIHRAVQLSKSGSATPANYN